MKRFARLYAALDSSTGTNDKVAALEEYFRAAPPADAAWALHLLSGNRPRRVVSAPRLREWAAEASGIPLWLLEECYHQVGDLAETVALLIAGDGGASEEISLADTIEGRLLPLREMPEAEQRETLIATWRSFDTLERFVWNKLLTGAFRVGAAGKLATRAVARVAGLPETAIAHRLMGAWEPSAASWNALLSHDTASIDRSQPYPFCLASPLTNAPDTLGDRNEWIIEWKWDGIRAQLVRRDGNTWLWSRGEELLAGRFPELEVAATRIADGTVLDGEILPWLPDTPAPMPFAQLQRRIQRKTVSRGLLAEVPVVFVAYDLLEHEGRDIRDEPLQHRRAILDDLVASLPGTFRISPLVEGETWEQVTSVRSAARDLGSEGLMIKRADGAYLAGRKRGGWWKWKVDPYTVDAVLTAAQGGSGRRAGLFTDYTFAVWDGDTLVTLAKAYSGLTDEEIRKVDAFVRRHTLERFGPVRTVEPQLVFELAFEGLQRSARHKSGIAVRFPRIARSPVNSSSFSPNGGGRPSRTSARCGMHTAAGKAAWCMRRPERGRPGQYGFQWSTRACGKRKRSRPRRVASLVRRVRPSVPSGSRHCARSPPTPKPLSAPRSRQASCAGPLRREPATRRHRGARASASDSRPP
jgi:DNA ligase-1